MGWNHQPEYTWLITSHVFFVVKFLELPDAESGPSLCQDSPDSKPM